MSPNFLLGVDGEISAKTHLATSAGRGFAFPLFSFSNRGVKLLQVLLSKLILINKR